MARKLTRDEVLVLGILMNLPGRLATLANIVSLAEASSAQHMEAVQVEVAIRSLLGTGRIRRHYAPENLPGEEFWFEAL